MTITISAQGPERKRLVNSIAEYLGEPARYRGVPTCTYAVGDFTIERDGSLTFDDSLDSKIISKLLDHLQGEGFKVKQAEENTPTGWTVSIPLDKVKTENLTSLLVAKGSLIKKALGLDTLPVEISEDAVSFPWFQQIPDADTAKAYTEFLAALCKMSREQKRITAKEKAVDNEKYAFRCFLLRLGFIGDEYKAARKILLRNLTGSSAFKKGGTQHAVSGREVVECLRRDYPAGTRVELVRMDDPQAPPAGTKGTVQGVDDAGSIMVSWDNGCGLSLAFGEDRCRKLR